MPLTPEQFQNIEVRAEEIFLGFDKKEALILARETEKQIAGAEPALAAQAKFLTAQLKWLACQLLVDRREFLKLIKENLLEGLILDEKLWPNSLLDLVTDKFETQFSPDLEEPLQQILQAMQENKQVLGSQPLKFGNVPQQPTVGKWLLDFLRSSPENPTEIDETNYLFSNENAQTLPEEEKKLLGKVLSFYGTFRLVLRELTRLRTQERVGLETYLPPTEAEEERFSPPARRTSSLAQASLAAQKTLREILQENKEIFNQLLTINPIKISGTEELTGPTLRNWLADYVKEKGARLHESAERNDYLARNPNTQKLPLEERNILAGILKAYDEPKTLLPFSGQTQQISINELRGQSSPPSKPALPPQSQNPPIRSAPSSDRYRESVEENYSRPQKPASPPRPAPKISGNVIDLKDFK